MVYASGPTIQKFILFVTLAVLLAILYRLNSYTPLEPSATKSFLSPIFLECMEDVGMNLPIDKNGNFKAHHYDAKTGKWNEGIRFHTFEGHQLDQNSVILDLGGNVRAADSVTFKNKFNATMHIFEPVPAFFEKLQQNWKDAKDVTLHNYGLGASTKVLQVPVSALAGESTNFLKSATGDKTFTLEIRDAVEVVQDILKQTGHDHIDILHANCEGCEWETLARLAEANMFHLFKYLQISFHNYGDKGIGPLMVQYCQIREALLPTHKLVQGVPFGWERWELRQ